VSVVVIVIYLGDKKKNSERFEPVK
jgi:hypothetical protein